MMEGLVGTLLPLPFLLKEEMMVYLKQLSLMKIIILEHHPSKEVVIQLFDNFLEVSVFNLINPKSIE